MTQQEINNLFPYVARKEERKRVDHFEDCPDSAVMNRRVVLLAGGILAVYGVIILLIMAVAHYGEKYNW